MSFPLVSVPSAFASDSTVLRSERQSQRFMSEPSAPERSKAAAEAPWACSRCSFLNRPHKSRCDMCRNARAAEEQQPHSAAAGSLSAGQWQCTMCTFINTSGAGQGTPCEVCASAPSPAAAASTVAGSNPASAASASAAAGAFSAAAAASNAGWSCHVCRTLNTAEAMRCHSCMFFNPAVTQQTMMAGGGAAARAPAASQGRSVRVAAPAPAAATAAASSSSSSGLLDSGDEAAAAQLSEILSVCGAVHKNFVDPDFRPGDLSIYGSAEEQVVLSARRTAIHDPLTGEIVGTKAWGPFGWARARQLTKHSAAPWTVLPHNADGIAQIRPQDIRQGLLGDCWFVSALSVLAERPGLISHLLVTPDLNTATGVYQVRFCKSGRWQVITIDDYLPIEKDTGKLAFSHSTQNQLWVALVEKAYAKLHGSYSAIESGSICDAFTDLTGAPAERIELHPEEMSHFSRAQIERSCGGDKRQQQEFIWAQILSFRQSKFLMGASCGKRGVPAEVYQRVGLRADHAYAVLDACIVQGTHLIHLRNPWGTSSWNGAWSSSSSLWTAALRKQLRLGSLDASGSFWMSYDEFLQYFRTIDVCKFQDDWHVVRLADEFPLLQTKPPSSGWGSSAASSSPEQQVIPLQQNGGWDSSFMYELSVPVSTCCFISLIQPDLRGTRAPKPHNYKSMGLFLLKERDGPLQQQATKDGDNSPASMLSTYQRCQEVFPDTQKMVTCDSVLPASTGRYLIVPCSFAATIAAATTPSSAAAAASSAPPAASFPFVLCIYSAHPVLVRRRPAFLPALTLGVHLSAMVHEAKLLSGDATLYTICSQGGLFFVVANRSTEKWLSISLDCAGSEGVLSSRRAAGASVAQALRTHDLVPPRHRQLLMALVAPRSDTGYKYTRHCTFFFTEGVASQAHTPPLREGFDLHQPLPIDLHAGWHAQRRG